MTRIAILASGNGSNAENLILYFKKHASIEVGIVCTNNSKAGVVNRCERLNIPLHIFANSDLENGDLLRLLDEKKIQFVILAGFLRKIPSEFISRFPDRIINIHPALLPEYGGKGMYGMFVHEAVIENQELESGITIHLVNEEYDRGKHLFQANIALSENETPTSLAEKIHLLEHQNFAPVVEKYIESLT